MATTETRPGFRLPWTSDHRETRSTSDDAASTEGETTPDATATDGTPGIQEQTIDASEETVSATAAAPSAPSAQEASARPRPTKFLADLTRAMQAAAQAERDELLRGYREDAKGYVEQYRAEAAERATAYRREADEDVAGIRDWSKAEMARIREETERRIANRKSELESELEDHGDRVDRAIAGIQSRVDAYEAEMEAFFERLLAVDDPTAFAAMAAGMPEPPAFTPEPPSSAATITVAEPATAPEPEAEAPDLAASPESQEAPAAPTDSAWAGATWSSEAGTAEDAESGPAPSAGEPAAASVPAARGPSAADDRVAPLAATLLEEPVDPRIAALGLAPDLAAAEAEAAVDLAGDGSDDAEGMVPVDDDELAARIAGLVAPTGAQMPSGETASTQVVVVGLVSVASIAGFKRNLAHAAGVHSVSVSSGPDGEFIFTTVHDGVDLPAVVATLPGFAARVTDTADGAIHVVAHDPEAAS